MALDFEAELDRIYGAELGDFVAERTKVARALAKEGRRAEAERVKELRKPPLPVWAINQLARKKRKDVDLLLDAANRLAFAQRALLTGGDRATFERASKLERDTVNRLAKHARTILGERGSAATLERVVATLRGAAASDAARADLARGRLTEEVELTGFEVFGSAAAKAEPPPPRPQARRASDDEAKRAEAARRAAIARVQAELESARGRETKAAGKLRQAERAERDARARHEQAAATLAKVRAEHEAAHEAVEAAREKLADAQS